MSDEYDLDGLERRSSREGGLTPEPGLNAALDAMIRDIKALRAQLTKTQGCASCGLDCKCRDCSYNADKHHACDSRLAVLGECEKTKLLRATLKKRGRERRSLRALAVKQHKEFVALEHEFKKAGFTFEWSEEGQKMLSEGRALLGKEVE